MAINTEQEEWLAGFLSATEDAKISDWERNFMDDQRKRYEEYGANINLSPKQWSILSRIAGKIGYDAPAGAAHA